MISSKLKESEIGLLQSICWELDFMVDDFISREVKRIVEKALMAGEISKIDLEKNGIADIQKKLKEMGMR